MKAFKSIGVVLFTLSYCFLNLSVHAGHVSSLFLRDGLSLNGDWNIIIDPYENGYFDYRWNPMDEARNPSVNAHFTDSKARNASALLEYNFDTSPTLKVPGDWNTQMRELLYYEGTVSYRKKFEFDSLKNGERAFLHFEAVNYEAHVYLNGKKVGLHVGGFTPFSFEVTKRLRKGSNSLVVRVDNKRHKAAVPTLNTDWWNYGGITRDVKLVSVPATFIAGYTIALDSEETGIIRGEVQLDGVVGGSDVEIRIPELDQQITVRVDEEGVAAFQLTTSNLDLWSPESPTLYDVQLTFAGDVLSDRVGFRTIRTQGKNVLLNGKPVFLRGICVHEELALNGGGRVVNADQARQLLEWAKDLNCNFVRLAHYPHNQYMVRLADELGVMVWSEIPVYWTIDWEDPSTYENAEAQLTDMIERDRNRASVIIWSLANETPVSEARTRFLSRLAERARGLDDTRLLSAAMEKHGKPGAPNVSLVQDPLADLVDLVSFNEYVGWYDGLPEKCERVSWEIPYDKPVFVSEFGGGAKQGLHGEATDRWTEEFQDDLYVQTLKMLDGIDGLCGLSPWILVDFRSPRRPLPGIQDGFNRKGLISDEGIRKKAFFTLQKYYKEKSETSN